METVTNPPTSADQGSVAGEDAWKTLGVVIEWIKHAETKAGATLAAAGVLGGLIYTLAQARTDHGAIFIVAAAVCGICVLVATAAAGVALWPRRGVEQVSTNLLYYGHVADRFPADPTPYTTAFRELVRDRDSLESTIVQQIWANSRVARDKYRWVNVAILALLCGVFSLAVTAVVSLFDGR